MEHKWNRSRLIEYAQREGFTVLDGVPQPGALYIAGRNTEPQLLTCKSVNDRGWIVAKEMAYSFDWHECIRIK